MIICILTDESIGRGAYIAEKRGRDTLTERDRDNIKTERSMYGGVDERVYALACSTVRSGG